MSFLAWSEWYKNQIKKLRVWACKGFRYVPGCQLSGIFCSSIHTVCFSFKWVWFRSPSVITSLRSSGIDDLVQQGWLCMAGNAPGRHWRSPSGIRRHDGCVMKQSQKSSLILINPLISYGKVLSHKTKFHPKAPQYYMSWYLIWEDIFIISKSIVSEFLRQ